MGLTIHYSFESETPDRKAARTLVEKIRSLAMDLPFDEVGQLVELRGKCADFNHPDFQSRGNLEEHRWLAIQACQYVTFPGDRPIHLTVPPQEIIAFEMLPGPGCESANFGLCRYPSRILAEIRSGRKKQIDTGLGGRWRWSSFCKTQYASDPKCGGVANFLRCHISLITLLDRIAERLGVSVECNDEGGYGAMQVAAEGGGSGWVSRPGHYSPRLLAEEIGRWNEMIASFVGRLNDIVRPTGVQTESAISQFSNFEELEFRGQEKAAGVNAFLAELQAIVARQVSDRPPTDSE
jgi:hypothetical protein